VMAAMEQRNGAAPLVDPSLQTQAAQWHKRQCWQCLSGIIGSDGASAAANLGGSDGNGAAIVATVSDNDEDKQFHNRNKQKGIAQNSIKHLNK
jgi:hypothetical protein